MTSTEVTQQVEFSNPDDELLSIRKCICGESFAPWEFIISTCDDDINGACPKCGRKYFFKFSAKVYQVENK